jgi:hypothetical protein
VRKSEKSIPDFRRAARRAENVGGAPIGDDIEHGNQLVLGDEAERLAHALRGHAAVAHRQHLIGDAQASRIDPSAARAIAASASGSAVIASAPRTRDKRSRISAGPIRLKSKRCSRLRTGRRRLRDFLRLGRREDEDDARRRFLENLEQRVPCFTREHVRFVDDVHLVAFVARRGVHRALAELTRIVDAAVRRRVDLDDVETRGASPNPATGVALATWLAVEPRIAATFAIQRHGEHTRECRLAHAARPAEEIAVRHAPARDRALQRRRDVRLHGNVGEALRAIFAGESERHDGGRTKSGWGPGLAIYRAETCAAMNGMN